MSAAERLAHTPERGAENVRDWLAFENRPRRSRSLQGGGPASAAPERLDTFNCRRCGFAFASDDYDADFGLCPSCSRTLEALPGSRCGASCGYCGRCS